MQDTPSFTSFELCSPKFGNLQNSPFMSKVSSLVLLMMMAFYDGDVGDDNYDGDATYYDIMIPGQNLRCFCDHL